VEEGRKVGNGALVSIPRTVSVRSEKGVSLDKEAYITPMAATESSYLALVTKGPTEYLDEDIPALAVCSSYLQAVEGPLWRGIRGTGLAYGASIFRSVETGQIVLDIYRGTDAGRAVSVAKDIVGKLADGTNEFEETFIEGAICSIVNVIAINESNSYEAAVSQFFNDYIKKRGPHFNSQFMAAIRRVTKDDLQRVINKYFVPMFDPTSSIVFIACHPSMVDALHELFKGQGYIVTVNALIGNDDSEESDSDD
jgi:Zn-dependent M16 (insulinase) family peptidase